MDKLLDLRFKINGDHVELKVHPEELLVNVIRERLGLTGTKKGCGEGECGACTVLLDGKPVNSCLVTVMKADGKEITTIEGLEKDGQLHPIQESFMEQGAIQCGFCAPGVILSAKALLDIKPEATDDDIKLALSGNLCRCTGYAKFVGAVKSAAQKIKHT